MDAGEESKAVRSRHSRAVRAKAPLAANFEDCLQVFDRLLATTSANKQELDDEHILAEDYYGRLKTWGHDSGASSRALDHRLRKSSQLATATSDLLVELQSILQDASYLREPTERPFEIDESISASTEEIGTHDDGVPDLNILQSLEDVVEIIDCLFNLLPNIQNPEPQINYEANASSEDAAEDIKLAMMLFPKAPQSLNERLGRANWKRRQNLKQARQRSFPMEATKSSRAANQLGIESTKTPKQRKKLAKTFANFRRCSASRGTSDAGMSITSSIVETIFSKTNFFDGRSVTSIAVSEEPYTIPFLTPPAPPVPLIPGSCFNCPYCCLEIIVGAEVTTTQDWINHVYLDIEPYLCTFDSCIRADKLFGIREDWFQHELYCHRIQKVWFCRMPLCKNAEFSTQALFEKHFQLAHKDLFASKQLSVLVENCQRYSEKPLPKQTCILCGNTSLDTQTFENHLATHLEQFAFIAIADDTSSEDEEDISSADGDEDAMAEKARADFLLDEFVEEQTGLFLPRLIEKRFNSAAVQPQQVNLERKPISEERTSTISFQPGSSDTSSADGNPDETATRKEKEELWAGKVEGFLGKQAEVDRAAEFRSRAPTVRTNLPPRNPNFVGRTTNFKAIQASLSSNGQICSLSGRGGIGKTSIIIEYSYRYEENYSYIFWVEAETPGSRADSYSLIASMLGLGGDIIHDQEGLTILVREFLQRTDKKWLLIFDNTEEWSDISHYIPRNLWKTAGSVLITTRNSDLLRPARNYHPLGIDAFTLEESRQLLLCSMQPSLDQDNLCNHPEYHLAAAASKLVDRLPLAISMIAGYVQVSRCSLSEFLEIWNERQSRSRKASREGEAGASSPEDVAIDMLWDIGIRELPLAARNLLDILVFLDAESIPKDLLVGDHKEPFLEFLNSAETIRYRRMIAELNGRRLVDVKVQGGKQTLSIHRLLQEKILRDLERDKFTEVFGKAFCLVRKRFPPASPIQVPEPSKWSACKEYAPHVLSLRHAFKATTAIEPSFDLALLFYDAGFHVWERQTTPDEGVFYLEAAEEILDRLKYDPNAKIRADIHTMMALLYSIIGISFRAQTLQRCRDALAIRQKVHKLDPEDSNNDILFTNAASDLGYCLLDTWGYEEADKIYQSCYQKYCQWGTENELPFEYSKHYENNGRVSMYRGNYSEAISLFRRGLELSEKALGKTWRCWVLQSHIACTMLQSGDAQSALEMHLEVFSTQEKALGKYDSATIMSNYAVGAAYHHLGNLSAAAERMEECIQLANDSKWSEEALARTRFHLSRIYAEQGIQQEEAQKLEEQGLAVLEKYSNIIPEYLTGVTDKMMLFDDLQPSVGGRFTSRALLSHMQKRNSGS